jgi:hypothetical protein
MGESSRRSSSGGALGRWFALSGVGEFLSTQHLPPRSRQWRRADVRDRGGDSLVTGLVTAAPDPTVCESQSRDRIYERSFT